MIDQLALLLPVGVVLGTALVVVFLDLMIPHKDRYILPWVGMGGLVLTGVAVYHVLEKMGAGSVWFQTFSAKPGEGALSPLILNGSFCLDGFGVSAWFVCAIAGFLAILAGPTHGQQDEHPLLTTGEYYGLILLTVSGMMLLCVSYDWITLLLSLEIMSIATYILTGSNRENSKSNEGAIKYLVLGAFSSAFLMMGIAFYYGAFGHISVGSTPWMRGLPEQEAIARSILLWVSMGLILVGVLFKLGAAPFHFWVPDVYEGAPSAITGLMAVGVKTAAFAVAARLAFDTFTGSRVFSAKWVDAILVISVLTMIVGNILAMRQSNLKRMLAYSGIAHTGYLLLALLVIPGDRGGGLDPVAVESHTKAALFYLLSYGVMTLGAFGVISMVREDGRPLETIDDFKGLAKEHPGVALCMAIFMFSLAGLPPTGGFFAKFVIFRSAMEQSQYRPEIIIAAVIGVLTSVASLYYYLKVVIAMYMPDHGENEVVAAKCRYEWNSSLLIYTAGIVTVLVGLLPGKFWF